jgi:hypothetical protein
VLFLLIKKGSAPFHCHHVLISSIVGFKLLTKLIGFYRHPAIGKDIKLHLWFQLNEGGIKSKIDSCLTLMGVFSSADFKGQNDSATDDISLVFERIIRGGGRKNFSTELHTVYPVFPHLLTGLSDFIGATHQ